jgi:hypothetical protein
LAIHIQRHTYDPEEPLTPWVHAIARYKLIDFCAGTAHQLPTCRSMKPMKSRRMTIIRAQRAASTSAIGRTVQLGLPGRLARYDPSQTRRWRSRQSILIHAMTDWRGSIAWGLSGC